MEVVLLSSSIVFITISIEAMAKPYQLALTLHGHSADVRSLAAPNAKQPLLISASRDGSAIVWGPSSNGKDWDAKLRVEELERRFVNCATLVNYRGQRELISSSANSQQSSASSCLLLTHLQPTS